MLRYLYIVSGTLSLILGVVGIFIPLLPTTPFLLLAAALYFKSSHRLYDWLLRNRYLGVYIRNFREYKAIPLRAKIVSTALLWATIGYCVLAVVDALWLRLLLAAIAVGVTIHIWSYKTLRKNKNDETHGKS